MSEDWEKRVEPRIYREERLFVHVVSSPENPDAAGKTIKCVTADVSASGLKLQVAEAIERGAHVQLWINLTAHDVKLLLDGEVKWVRTRADGIITAGVELSEEGADDLGTWKSLLYGKRTS